MLTDKDPATGEYRIPHIIYSDAYYSEMVAYADLVLPDTTYLERWDCISLLDRPICGADGPADAIRQPVVAPDRDVRPFQDVLIELGARLGLPGFVNAEGAPRYPGGYTDYIVNHERTPGHRAARRLARRGRRGARQGRAEPEPARALHREWLLLEARAAAGAALLQARQQGLSRNCGQRWGLIGAPEPIVLQLYVEPLQRFRLAAQGHGAVAAAGEAPRADRDLFRPAAVLVSAVRGSAHRPGGFPLHAITQRPMQMYHSWDSQNAWLRQILGAEPAVHEPRDRRARSASTTTTGSGCRAMPAASRRRSS